MNYYNAIIHLHDFFNICTLHRQSHAVTYMHVHVCIHYILIQEIDIESLYWFTMRSQYGFLTKQAKQSN